MSVYHVSIPLLIMNSVITLSKYTVDPQEDSRVNPQTTLIKLWRNSLLITGQTHEKLASIIWVFLREKMSNCLVLHRLQIHVSAYWKWKLAHEHARISAVSVKLLLGPSKLPYRMLETNTSVQAKCFTLSGSYFILQLSYAWMSSWVRTFSIALWVYIAFSHRNIYKMGNNN